MVSQVAGQKKTVKTARLEVTSVEMPDAEKIRAHVKFLSSDLLEGRGTGQRGGDIAAEYIATQFALDGLKPAGENGTYYQNVPMVSVKTLPATSFKLIPKNGDALTLKNLDEFVTNNESQTETADFDAPTRVADGIIETWVNGASSYVWGQGATPARAGRLVTRNRC